MRYGSLLSRVSQLPHMLLVTKAFHLSSTQLSLWATSPHVHRIASSTSRRFLMRRSNALRSSALPQACNLSTGLDILVRTAVIIGLVASERCAHHGVGAVPTCAAQARFLP